MLSFCTILNDYSISQFQESCKSHKSNRRAFAKPEVKTRNELNENVSLADIPQCLQTIEFSNGMELFIAPTWFGVGVFF